MHRSRRRSPGLTLLEVVISIALIGLLFSAMLTFYWQSMAVRQQAARLADRTQIARQVLERLATELRGCLGAEQFGFPVERRLIGDRRSIRFITTALPGDELYHFFGEFDQLPPGQHDLREVGYRLWVDPEQTTPEGEPIVGGILRSEKKTLNQFLVDEENPEQLRHDLWSYELAYLEFRYFDGVEWATAWEGDEGAAGATGAGAGMAGQQQGNPLPQLVQITVGFTPITRAELEDQDLSTYPLEEYPLGDTLPHSDRYSTIVRIPAADKFFSSRLQRVGRAFSEQFGVQGEGLE